MKTKSKKIVTTVIILLVLIAVVFAVLTVGNKHKANNTNETTTETTAEQTTANVSTEVPEYYSEIITQCKNAFENDFYKDYIDPELEKIKGKYIPSYTLNALANGDVEPKIYYALHDIDKNGIPEMILAIKDDNGYDFQDIFTYADGKIEPIFGEYFGMNYRDVFSNGIIASYGSDGECDYYSFRHFAKDGHTLLYLDSLHHFYADGKNKYTRELINNDDISAETPTIEISKEEFDLIGKLYTGQKLKDVDESMYTRSDINFEWKTIE
ncbi:MAG: hypothetical protein NC177_17275 [Ruminococcus flavefaciens]|nr:hypothetical protein [Ruminococcus flavefaciens]